MQNLLKKFKVIVALLAFTLIMSPISTFASTSNTLLMDESDYTITTITAEDVPRNITPVEFDSEIEARNYFENVANELEKSKLQVNDIGIQTYGYNGSRYASKSLTTMTLNMYVSYRAEWNSTYGNYYSSAEKPSTDITGLTLGFGWRHNSSSSYSNIGGNPQNLSAHGEGYLDYYIIIEGIIKYYTKTISIDASWGQP